VHLYPQNSATVTVDGVEVGVSLRSQYPWHGEIELELTPAVAQEFALHLRIPGWCDEWRLFVNGAPVVDMQPGNGYIAVTRQWQPGDRVALSLAMPVQTVWAHPAVRQMQGRLAIQRGPVVYCLEGVDNPGIENLDRITFSAEQVAGMTTEYRSDLLGGVTVLRGQASLIAEEGWDAITLYRRNRPSSTQPIEVTAVPYAVWDNRAAGEMRVWFRCD
jgi:DUF1680 family protein